MKTQIKWFAIGDIRILSGVMFQPVGWIRIPVYTHAWDGYDRRKAA